MGITRQPDGNRRRDRPPEGGALLLDLQGGARAQEHLKQISVKREKICLKENGKFEKNGWF